MKKYYLFFFLTFLFSCKRQLTNEKKSVYQSKVISHKELENRLRQTIHGIPLGGIPILEKSTPALFLMPVSNTPDSLVEKVYLIDGTRDDFLFERDFYKIICIGRSNAEDSIYKNMAFVSNVRYKTLHLFEIDGFMYHQIMKINKGEWDDYPTAVKIPAFVRSATTNELREASEILLTD
jgi:hypothetical protein